MSNVDESHNAKQGNTRAVIGCPQDAELIPPSRIVFGPCTPLYMDDAQLEAEFAYIMKCYASPEKTAAP